MRVLRHSARRSLRPRGQGTGVVLAVPALLATIVVQRGFVRGLTFGAVKQ